MERREVSLQIQGKNYTYFCWVHWGQRANILYYQQERIKRWPSLSLSGVLSSKWDPKVGWPFTWSKLIQNCVRLQRKARFPTSRIFRSLWSPNPGSLLLLWSHLRSSKRFSKLDEHFNWQDFGYIDQNCSIIHKSVKCSKSNIPPLQLRSPLLP